MIRTTITLTLLATPALADCDLRPDAAMVPLASYHHAATTEFNERNPGLIVGWDCYDWRIGVGAYRNSFAETSAVITASYRFEIGDFYADPFIGLADYGDHTITGGPITPIAGVTVRHKDVPICAQILPGHQKSLDYAWLGVLAICAEF